MLVLLHALETQLYPYIAVSISFVELERWLLSACGHLGTENIDGSGYRRAACSTAAKNVT